MHIIVYTSQYTKGSTCINEELIKITKSAKKNNPGLNITGVLFYHNRRFLQVIEGEKASLEALMAVLEKDQRHTHIERIIDEPIEERSYSDWNMDSFNLSQRELLDVEELKIIRDVYRENLTIKSTVLVDFYKAMLDTHQLRPDLAS